MRNFSAPALLLLAFASAPAAVLTGSVDSDPPVGVNLTTEGSLDWAIWNTTSSSAVASIAPTNIKDGGPGLIGAISGVGGSSGSVRGYGGATQTYSYTDGTSPTTLSSATQGFVGNATLDSLGSGVTLTIVGDPFQPLQVDIWTTGFRASGQMTVSLDGASDVILSSSFESTKTPALFSFVFQPDEITDVLTITYVVTEDTGSSAHIGIQAVTVSAVPEPGAVLLLGLAGMTLLFFRRGRRRAV